MLLVFLVSVVRARLYVTGPTACRRAIKRGLAPTTSTTLSQQVLCPGDSESLFDMGEDILGPVSQQKRLILP